MGYLRFPTIQDDTVLFVAEDDLWRVPLVGGRAWRLTSGVAEIGHPQLSPDGTQVAYVGRDDGPEEVYVLPIEGGQPRRLTFDAANCSTVGWHRGAILYASNAGLAFARDFRLWRLDPDVGAPEQLPVGPARTISHGPAGEVVLGRHMGGDIVRGRHNADPATWKRYRGGKAGTLWVDATGSGDFARLELEGNVASPCWVGERIYFVSDHEGVGNVYSCRPDGTRVRRHSDHEDFYARELTSDGRRLVYRAGGELYTFDPSTDEVRHLDIEVPSSATHRRRRFVPAAEHLEHARLRPGGAEVTLTARGKAFSFGCWEGPVRQHGERDGVRHRLVTHLDEGRLVAVAAGEDADEHLVLLPAGGHGSPRRLDHLDVGRARELAASPDGRRLAIANHRHELLVVDLEAEPAELHRADVTRFSPPRDLAWSPDGRWLAYAVGLTHERSAIAVFDALRRQRHQVTDPVLHDHRPAWDPDGRYLYFLGQRDFDPVHDQLHFERSFPHGSRPYLVTLRDGVGSPFVPTPRPVAEAGPGSTTGEVGESGEGVDVGVEVRIDLDGIADRIVAFDVPEGRYQRIAGLPGKVLFSSRPVKGNLGSSPFDTVPPAEAVLERYDFETQKTDTVLEGISDFNVDGRAGAMLVRVGDRLRVLPAGHAPPSDAGDEVGRASGWIDLDRVKVSVRPGAEWRQMFREAWRLQRDHYWAADMAGVDWEALYDHYLPLVDRVASRAELSDLLWEFQAELGTSHAYELLGDHRETPDYRQGHLGATWELDRADTGVRISALTRGDPWQAKATSPLRRPGVGVDPGDRVLEINGQPVGFLDDGPVRHPGEALVNQAEQEVELTVVRGDGEPRTVTVAAIADERAARYRDWVEANRAVVHEGTAGRVGYLHIPDMGDTGFGEFHRSFLQEHDREGLVVDVRFNGGGNVSPLLLEKLARRRRGYGVPRWFAPVPWPQQSPRGPLVAVTNEYAGSDGDMFSHAFKLMGLGPLIGTRTWGGVVGVNPSNLLADGTMTTQPEFYMTFEDVGWGLENHGAEPDIEVDVTPQDAAAGRDPQLDRAIEVVLERLEQQPPHEPRLPSSPRLARPPLPHRT